MSAKINNQIEDINLQESTESNDNPEVSINADQPSAKLSFDLRNIGNQDIERKQSELKQQKMQNHTENSQREESNKSPLENNAVKSKINEKKVKFTNTNGHKQRQDKKFEGNYQSLTYTLQTALKKMNTSKKQPNKLNKNKTMNLLHRFTEHEKKKQKQIEEKRAIEEERKYLGLKQKPEINPKSRKIAQQTSHKPIYERFERILEEKKKKMEQIEEEKKAKQEEQYEKFMIEYQSHVKLQVEDCRDSETFFHDMISWKSKLDKQRQEKHKVKQQKQVEGLTFKPQLNKRSVRMVEKINRVRVQDREITRTYNTEPNCSFQPKPFKRKNF